MNNNFKVTSQHLNTPITDWYLDVWEPRQITIKDTDRLFTITPRYEERPDLLSQDVYGTPRLWWVFVVRNKDILIDPIADFKAGTQIYIPENILK